MGYDFRIEYRKTEDFGQADALSRLIAEQAQPSEGLVIARATKEAEAACRAVRKILPVDMDKDAEESAQDDTIRKVMAFVREDSRPSKPSPEI
ncbi:unnamed protein product [Nippostrongylus brasiliensis]|uniref:ATP-binding protein n=1 Tax=Nippostrongylus brasiliensis TaxID=27835 RepID=A0A0N4YRY8_NIPBR|nr:unnamed protein product [Nippostrongylus brasiliensis]